MPRIFRRAAATSSCDNSELAVTLWIAYHRLFDRTGDANLVERYRKVYDPNQPGFIVMQRELKKLAQYAREHGNPPVFHDDP